MKKFLILVSTIAIMCAGCGTFPETSKELGDKVISWLEDNKPLVKEALVLAGLEIIDRAVKPEDKKAIANQMWAISTAYYSLANGEIVTQQKFDETISSFTSGSVSPGFSKYASQASVLWSSIYPKLKSSGATKLATEYLILFAQAAQQVAASYKENND